MTKGCRPLTRAIFLNPPYYPGVALRSTSGFMLTSAPRVLAPHCPTVINPPDKPHPATQITIEAIKNLQGLACVCVLFRTRLNRYIPFVSRPAIRTPPIPCRSPGTSDAYNCAIHAAAWAPRVDLCGIPSIGLHNRAQRRPKNSKTQEEFRIADFELRIYYLASFAPLFICSFFLCY